MIARRRILRLPAAVFLAAALPLAAETLKFTVVGIDYQEYATPILKALKTVPGVTSPTLDWQTGAASVEIAEGFDREKLRQALRDIGFEAVFPGETRKDLQPLPDEVRATLDIASASNGEKIEIARTLVPGKITLIDYWASWCGPCRLLDIRLQHLARANPKLAVRRVNVAKFDNAAGKQAVGEFRIEAIPYVRVYDANGKFVGDDTGGSWERVLALVEEASARGIPAP